MVRENCCKCCPNTRPIDTVTFLEIFINFQVQLRLISVDTQHPRVFNCDWSAVMYDSRQKPHLEAAKVLPRPRLDVLM